MLVYAVCTELCKSNVSIRVVHSAYTTITITCSHKTQIDVNDYRLIQIHVFSSSIWDHPSMELTPPVCLIFPNYHFKITDHNSYSSSDTCMAIIINDHNKIIFTSTMNNCSAWPPEPLSLGCKNFKFMIIGITMMPQ